MRRAVPIVLAPAIGLAGIPAHAETDDATRVEAGLKTGFSGPQIAADLTHGLRFRVIQAVRNERYSVAGDLVTADYVLDVGVLGIKLGGCSRRPAGSAHAGRWATSATTAVAERRRSSGPPTVTQPPGGR